MKHKLDSINIFVRNMRISEMYPCEISRVYFFLAQCLVCFGLETINLVLKNMKSFSKSVFDLYNIFCKSNINKQNCIENKN
jgi:hypothetical protein